MNLYAESSAILAWLLGESQGEDVRERLSAAERILTSDLTLIECDRVLHRAGALGELSEADVAGRRALVAAAAEHWVVLSIDGDVVDRSRRAFLREPISTLDAIHLSTAIVTRSLVTELELLSLDERIRANAVELGFEVAPRVA